jgi:hypothetical protein
MHFDTIQFLPKQDKFSHKFSSLWNDNQAPFDFDLSKKIRVLFFVILTACHLHLITLFSYFRFMLFVFARHK